MKTPTIEIEKLLKFALENGMIGQLDIPFSRNLLLDLLQIEKPDMDTDLADYIVPDTCTKIVKPMLDYAAEAGLIEDNTTTYRNLFDTRIIACVMPRPSEVNAKYNAIMASDGKKAATDWFYNLSRKSDYIRVDNVNRNIHWLYPTDEYGTLEITINLSKPEKDPREIAKLKNMPQSGYPKCLLCYENMGYAGRLNHPARQTIRVLPLTLNNEQWYMQYSPYVYYNQHCIVFKGKHEPMHIQKTSFIRLLDFTEELPHYFLGSNADLPIVGGSILSHDHFQGGAHVLPMSMAESKMSFHCNDFLNVDISIVKWPMSTIRLTCSEKAPLIGLSDKILGQWREYSDEKLGIMAYTDDTPHNTITPISRRRGSDYEIDLVLRNNRTSDAHPLGIYHPHANLHHIKRENIGLIEVMGLFILPARLKTEMAIVEDVLSGKLALSNEDINDSHPLYQHMDWLNDLILRYGTENTDAAEIVKKEIGYVCKNVLIDAGVYKDTAEGTVGLVRFLQSVGITK